ncbi:MAG: NAD(P)/FAD-dependent oxidoreductase [Aggregatilineales bacterium]
MTQTQEKKIIIIGAGIGGLTTAALLQKAGYAVTVLEAQTYPGGCASTFYTKGYRFESGATVVGGFQPDGPHAIVGDLLDLEWRIHQHDPAWVTHLPDRSVALTRDNTDVLAKFPGTEKFWEQQSKIADLGWKLSAQGLPWPPRTAAELFQLVKVGLRNFPQDLRLIPFAFSSVYDWLKWHGLHTNHAFVRFLDAQLLISAQTTTKNVNALYGATALDLARQGVFHVEGGIGGIAETLVERLESLGGEIQYRQRATRIEVQNGKVVGVWAKHGRRAKSEDFFPADFVIANTTPWNLNTLLGEHSPAGLQREAQQRSLGWGAFVLHMGIKADALPAGFPDHHQIITQMDGELGEGRSIFMSFSPTWDEGRAPAGERALTVTTHTNVQQWWDLLERDETEYYAQKDAYTEKLINAIDNVIPNFKDNLTLIMPGTPVTYNFYTDRHMGMVGGFPQTSLFKMRGPRTGISNLRLVGDSIFPGQSTAGVSLGALRVAEDVQHALPAGRSARSMPKITRERTARPTEKPEVIS